MGSACKALATLRDGHVYRPALGSGHGLFESSLRHGDFFNLVLCPAESGYDVILYDGSELWAKIKQGQCLQKALTRLDLHATHGGCQHRFPSAVLEKTRSVLSARAGFFSYMQAWHLAVSCTDVDPLCFGNMDNLWLMHPSGTGNAPAKRFKKPRGYGINMYMQSVAIKEGGAEYWRAAFKLSDPDYRLEVSNVGGGANAVSSAVRGVRVYYMNEVVCTGTIQYGEFLDTSVEQGRVLVGIQMKLPLEVKPPKGLETQPALSRHEAKSKYFLDLLPILLVIAWADTEASDREPWTQQYLQRFRSDVDVEGNRTMASTDIGWDPFPEIVNDQLVIRPLRRVEPATTPAQVQSLLSQLPVPPPPANALSEHQFQLTAEWESYSPMLSVSGI